MFEQWMNRLAVHCEWLPSEQLRPDFAKSQHKPVFHSGPYSVLFEAGLTRRFTRRLVADATVMSIRAASRHHGVGWHRIMGLVRTEASLVAERRRAGPSM